MGGELVELFIYMLELTYPVGKGVLYLAATHVETEAEQKLTDQKRTSKESLYVARVSAGKEAICPSIRGRHDGNRGLRTFGGSPGLADPATCERALDRPEVMIQVGRNQLARKGLDLKKGRRELPAHGVTSRHVTGIPSRIVT